ncbi:MAG: type II toxin-antitoxin system RelE/ParE family toxin [Verrucomicrobiota bacterium]|nr:type II toxin-antitoxin system RelE/ParE family toxin [Verrucomicrobiota bacterium]
MVHKIIWSPRALEDLREIVRYIRRDNPTAAKRFGEQLIERAENLAAFPERGRVIPKFADPTIRDILFRNYRIAYRIRNDSPHDPRVEIARIWHGARDESGLTL